MSQENVKIVRRAYARMGDLLHLTTAQIDRVFREVDEHFEFRLPADYPEGEVVFRGRDGIDELITLLRDTWREWRVEPERFLNAGGDRVVVFARIVALGEASGVADRARDHACVDHSRRSRNLPSDLPRTDASPRSRRAAVVGGATLGAAAPTKNAGHRRHAGDRRDHRQGVPPLARYCVGDVAGERGDRAQEFRCRKRIHTG